ncbi:MAG: zinc ribbon domain-containing protein [Pirellulales bacterium]
MPLYEFLCPKCNKQVEILVRNMEEKPECPECGHKNLQRQLSVAAAPAIGGKSLPVSHTGGGCGRPQCGSGKCMFE